MVVRGSRKKEYFYVAGVPVRMERSLLHVLDRSSHVFVIMHMTSSDRSTQGIYVNMA